MIRVSVLISISLFSSIAVILLKIVLRNNNAVLQLDVRFLMTCMLFILIRMLVPIEFPVTNNIPIHEIYPDIYIFIQESVFQIYGTEISVQKLLGIVWLVGSAVVFIKVLYSYIMIKRQLAGFQKMENLIFEKAAKKINAEYKRRVPFEILTAEEVNTPFVFGIIKPSIAIPKYEFTERDAYFVLKHEMLHYYRGDMVIKLLCELLKAIYWWNPFIYMLCDLMVDMQEINVDFKIIRNLPELEQLKYSECLVNVAKSRENKKRRESWLMSFQNESPLAVHKRISLMLENLEIVKKKTIKSIFLSAVIIFLVIICPIVFIFEPYSIREEDADGTFGLRDNVFYLRNSDGTYDFYLDSQYVGTVSEVSGDNTQIYDSLEEAKRNE